jgi:hypothetical protein
MIYETCIELGVEPALTLEEELKEIFAAFPLTEGVGGKIKDLWNRICTLFQGYQGTPRYSERS